MSAKEENLIASNYYEVIKLIHQNQFLKAVSAESAWMRTGLWKKLLVLGLHQGIAQVWRPGRLHPSCSTSGGPGAELAVVRGFTARADSVSSNWSHCNEQVGILPWKVLHKRHLFLILSSALPCFCFTWAAWSLAAFLSPFLEEMPSPRLLSEPTQPRQGGWCYS